MNPYLFILKLLYFYLVGRDLVISSVLTAWGKGLDPPPVHHKIILDFNQVTLVQCNCQDTRADFRKIYLRRNKALIYGSFFVFNLYER